MPYIHFSNELALLITLALLCAAMTAWFTVKHLYLQSCAKTPKPVYDWFVKNKDTLNEYEVLEITPDHYIIVKTSCIRKRKYVARMGDGCFKYATRDDSAPGLVPYVFMGASGRSAAKRIAEKENDRHSSEKSQELKDKKRRIALKTMRSVSLVK